MDTEEEKDYNDVVENALHDNRFYHYPNVTDGLQIRSMPERQSNPPRAKTWAPFV